MKEDSLQAVKHLTRLFCCSTHALQEGGGFVGCVWGLQETETSDTAQID